MPDASAFLLYVADGKPAIVYSDPAGVVGLAAATGVEGGAVEGDAKPAVLFVNGCDIGVELAKVGIVVEEFCGHRFLAPVSGQTEVSWQWHKKARPRSGTG